MSHQRRIPPTLFGVAFGLAGLGQVWRAANRVVGAPRAVANALFIVAAGADSVAGPFVPLALIPEAVLTMPFEPIPPARILTIVDDLFLPLVRQLAGETRL